MKKWLALLALLLFSIVVSVPAHAQWQVPNDALPVGRGTGTGFKSVVCGDASSPVYNSGWGCTPTRRAVTVQRTNSTGAATWGAYGPNGAYLTACDTSVTACAQAAVNLAFPYAAGTTALGYDLEFIGGDDAAPN